MEYDPEEPFKNSLIAALRAKAKDGTRTKIALLREVFDEVEAARKMGVRHKQIVELLASKGLVFDLRTYLVTRHRIAKERKQNESKKAPEKKFSAGIAEKITATTQENTKFFADAKVDENSASPEELRNLMRGKIDLSKYRKN